jgi:spore maturation protein CgeB
MANGLCMLLTDKYDGLGYEDLFEEGKHYVSYASAEEMLEKLRFYIDHPAAAIKMAHEAQKLVFGQHTYAHRCRNILGVL